MKPKGIQSKGGKVVYGNSYSDKKTQSTMMRVLRLSNKLTGSSRLGTKKPKTQLNKDAKPANDSYDAKITNSAKKGSVKGSEWQERLNQKPLALKKRNESQKNDYKPRSKKATARPTNTSSINRKYK